MQKDTKRSLWFWFWTILLSNGNWLVMLGALVVTGGFIAGGFTNHWALGAIGSAIFGGYLYTRIKIASDYKGLVDYYIDRGYYESTAIDMADEDLKRGFRKS